MVGVFRPSLRTPIEAPHPRLPLMREVSAKLTEGETVFHRTSGRGRHPASGGHISLFEKEKYGKEKTRLRARVF